MKILSSFTHSQVVPNLYECVCSAEHKGRYSEEWGTQSSIFSPTMEVNGAPKQPDYKLSSKYLPLCSAEQRNSYRFGSTWEWVNDDRIFIFGWTVPLRIENGIRVMHIWANSTNSNMKSGLYLQWFLEQSSYYPCKLLLFSPDFTN